MRLNASIVFKEGTKLSTPIPRDNEQLLCIAPELIFSERKNWPLACHADLTSCSPAKSSFPCAMNEAVDGPQQGQCVEQQRLLALVDTQARHIKELRCQLDESLVRFVLFCDCYWIAALGCSLRNSCC